MSDIAPPGKPQRIVYKTEDERPMKVNPEILKREKINIYNRDFCAHFLVPLNRCRRSQPMHVSFPWTCHEELHAYERCQHIEYVKLMHMFATYVHGFSCRRLKEEQRKLKGE